MSLEELLMRFKEECLDRASRIGEVDWFSLTVGWAIGRGLSPSEATEFAQKLKS